MAQGTFQDFNGVDVKIESVIAELVDNSIARKADRIDVVLKRDSNRIRVGTNLPHHQSPYFEDFSQQFSLSVFNDGNGFEDIDHLHSSFELVKTPGKEPERRENESGLFHVGMKESTLNKFHHFSIVANIGTEQAIRSIIFPGHNNEFLYDWNPYPESGNNPSNKLPEHLDIDWIDQYMNSHSFVTCAYASGPRENLAPEGRANIHDIHQISQFAETISSFLGLIYAGDLIDEKYKLNVVYFEDELPVKIKVSPIDLFWEQTTPDKIRERAENDLTLSPNGKYICETIYGYGTLKGHTWEIEIDLGGNEGLTVFEFTPYLLPHEQIREKLMEVGNNWNGYKMLDDPVSVISSGDIFNSESLQGVSFIRSGRMIVIGNHNQAENDGFYKLFSYQFPTANTKTRVRFKIEYKKGKYTDRLFDLKPNKDGYKEIKSEVWRRVMNALRSSINGNSRNLFYPLNRDAPFFVPGDTMRHFNGKAGSPSSDKWFKKGDIKVCNVSGCDTYHGKDIPCPKRPCSGCRTSLYLSECTPSMCKHVCEICGQLGHLQINCRESYCSICGLETCGCCDECEKPIVNSRCGCPCDVCDQLHDSDGRCGCPAPPPPRPVATPLPLPDQDHGVEKNINYFPSNKEHCIDAIRVIMNDGDITLDEL